MRRLLFLLPALLAGCVAASRGAASGVAAGVSGDVVPVDGGGFSGFDAIIYTGSGVLAYALGSLAKGWVRGKIEERKS